MLALYTYNISPYAAKVRAILRWKRIEFEERPVHPLKRGHLRKLTGRVQVPVLVDGETAISDSTAIARHLEQKFPERPIYPADPSLRARALLLEEWADEGLKMVVQGVRWVIPENARAIMKQFRAGYPAGLGNDLAFVAVGSVLGRRSRAHYGREKPDYLTRLDEVVGMVDDALDPGGFLTGDSPSVADFAAFGMLNGLRGLDGWQLVAKRPRVVKLLDALA